MDKYLTFGELCEAIVAGKCIQYDNYGQWEWIKFYPNSTITGLLQEFNQYKYRIKPEPVYVYQWLIKEHDGKFFLTTRKETEENARIHYGNMLVEPYLPSKEPVND